MAEKLMENLPDEDISSLGREVDRYMRDDANLSTAWIRTESRFGDSKFSAFKKVNLVF